MAKINLSQAKKAMAIVNDFEKGRKVTKQAYEGAKKICFAWFKQNGLK